MVEIPVYLGAAILVSQLWAASGNCWVFLQIRYKLKYDISIWDRVRIKKNEKVTMSDLGANIACTSESHVVGVSNQSYRLITPKIIRFRRAIVNNDDFYRVGVVCAE